MQHKLLAVFLVFCVIQDTFGTGGGGGGKNNLNFWNWWDLIHNEIYIYNLVILKWYGRSSSSRTEVIFFSTYFGSVSSTNNKLINFFLDQCGNNLEQKCCNQVVKKGDNNPLGDFLYGAKLITLQDFISGVGLNCLTTSIGILGVGSGGNGCNAQAACCGPIQQYGFINLGCTPININI